MAKKTGRDFVLKVTIFPDTDEATSSWDNRWFRDLVSDFVAKVRSRFEEKLADEFPPVYVDDL
jgi:hypothetical protein